MSGVMIKTAIYGLIRSTSISWEENSWWWGVTILIAGTVSALLGVMYALMEHDLKGLLAFHSVENIGIILLGIGAGTIFHTYGLQELAALGCWPVCTTRSITRRSKHCCSSAPERCSSPRTPETSRSTEACFDACPGRVLCFPDRAVSIAALPPTNGFVSEWLVFQSPSSAFNCRPAPETHVADCRRNAGL